MYIIFNYVNNTVLVDPSMDSDIIHVGIAYNEFSTLYVNKMEMSHCYGHSRRPPLLVAVGISYRTVP